MLVITHEVTINFDKIRVMYVENEQLIFSYSRGKDCLIFKSSEKAHQARRLIESAYAHGEKICKV